MLNSLTKDGGVLSGEDAFKLYDTYGFPLDLTKDILAEKNMTVDEETFNELMEKQRQLARSSRKSADAESWKSDGISFDGVNATEFKGYTENECRAKILDIVTNGEHTVAAGEGEKAIIVLDKTVFYGEGGGQVGDTGVIKAADFEFKVTDTKKTAGGVFTHFGTVIKGTAAVDTAVTALIDNERREAIRRNHTAAHLLQAGLRKVLGTHVEQAGQLVNENAVRFDFTHFSALTAEELAKVEDFVNGAVLAGISVENTEMPIEKAKELGAMALFGEKYGDIVRVVNVPEKSIELCGGTHIDNTAKIGLFKIVSESSVAAGVRRIEAVTGLNVLKLIDDYKNLATETAVALKASSEKDIARRAEQLMKELRDTEKQLEKAEAKIASSKIDSLLKNAQRIGGLRLVAGMLEGAAADELRKTADTIKNQNEDVIAVLATVSDGKLTFCVSCAKAAVAKGAHAGNLVREIAKIAGGNGGGKPDLAMAGGKDISKVKEALAAAENIVSAQIGV